MSKKASQPEPVVCSFEESSATRREFFTRIRAGAGLALASSAVPLGSSAQAESSTGAANQRVVDSFQNRLDAARDEAKLHIATQATSGDEQRFLNFIGNFHKGLRHNSLGEVNQADYLAFLSALRQGRAAAFEPPQLILGGNQKLVNPLAGAAFDLEGTDSHQLAIDPFPSVTSRELADLAIELYWMALCRDIKFTDYAADPTVGAAVTELSSLPRFSGVTRQTLFRGFTSADPVGPYLSQLLLKPFNYGPYAMSGKMSMYSPGVDYLTVYSVSPLGQYPGGWWDCLNGRGPFAPLQIDPSSITNPRVIRTGRDLATYVHEDPKAGLFMSFYNAGIFLSANGAQANPGNPYLGYLNQAPFATFGPPFFFGLIGEATNRAFKAAWYAKWFVHRALRPDQYGGLVHMRKTGQNYPIHGDILKSSALDAVFAKYGTYFLPQAYPEAGPQHPSYPSGHATMAGACATILKAAFGDAHFTTLADGKMAIDVASDDGLTLVPYKGLDAGQITIYGEINKLASNISQGRNFAGIHWRSDAEWGMRLGEAVALSVLRDQSNNYVGENFDGFTITKFDGTMVTV